MHKWPIFIFLWLSGIPLSVRAASSLGAHPLKEKHKKHSDTNNRMLITGEKGVVRKREESKGSNIQRGKETRLLQVASTHQSVYRFRITGLYIWNLYNAVNQCHSSRLGKNGPGR